MFSWQEQILTRSLRSHVILFLPREHKIHIFELRCSVFILYRYTDEGVFDDFPKISDHFPKILDNLSEDHTNVAEHFSKIFEDL